MTYVPLSVEDEHCPRCGEMICSCESFRAFVRSEGEDPDTIDGKTYARVWSIWVHVDELEHDCDYGPTTFTEDFVEFWRLMGTRAFWDLPPWQRHGALIGLWHSHMESGERDVDIRVATQEYMRREELVLYSQR